MNGISTFTIFGWGFAGLAFAFIFIRIINAWLIDRVIGAVHALILMMVIFLLSACIWTTQGSETMIVYIALMIGAAGATQLIAVESERRLMRRMRDDDMAKYRAVIARDPKNAAAHAYLAAALAEMREYDEAITEYETAISLSPQHSRTERYRLHQVVQAKLRAEGQAGVQCLECRAESPRGSRFCIKCGASLNTSFLVWLFTPRNLLDVLFRSAIPLLIAVILIASLYALPITVTACVIGASVVVGVIYFFRWLGRDHPDA